MPTRMAKSLTAVQSCIHTTNIYDFAAEPSDYTMTRNDVTVPSGSSLTMCQEVLSIVDDQNYEGEEGVLVNFATVLPPALMVTTSSIGFSILDPEGMLT